MQGKEIGAAVAAWVDGELVVNLWAGSADAAGTRPWQVDTLSTVLSGTKGLTSTCVHQLVERGELDLNAPVARYWPEFAQAGKAGHHPGHGDEPPVGGDRAPAADGLDNTSPTGITCANAWPRPNRGGSRGPRRAIT